MTTETVERSHVSGPSAVERRVMRLRLAVVKTVCRLLLPRNVWIGLHFGAYSQKWSIHLGRLDSRGVLQGLSDHDAGA
jgi:hypothetical protein